ATRGTRSRSSARPEAAARRDSSSSTRSTSIDIGCRWRPRVSLGTPWSMRARSRRPSSWRGACSSRAASTSCTPATRPTCACRPGYLVGYVGVMGRQEGVDYLLRAVHHIVFGLGRCDIHFGLVGGGTALKQMQELAEELGVAEFVTFTGRVPDPELLGVLNTADVCVNPDVANDMNDKSTMNKIMEYMALGKPIVQFDLTEGRFSAQSASLYARRNDAVDLA